MRHPGPVKGRKEGRKGSYRKILWHGRTKVTCAQARITLRQWAGRRDGACNFLMRARQNTESAISLDTYFRWEIFDMFHWLLGWYCSYCAAQCSFRPPANYENNFPPNVGIQRDGGLCMVTLCYFDLKFDLCLHILTFCQTGCLISQHGDMPRIVEYTMELEAEIFCRISNRIFGRNRLVVNGKDSNSWNHFWERCHLLFFKEGKFRVVWALGGSNSYSED